VKVRKPVIGLLLLSVPVTVLASDLYRRGSRIRAFEGDYALSYAAAILESIVVWGVLLYAASRRRGALGWVAALLFVVFSTFAIGGQTYFFQQYHAYLNVDVSLFASNFWDSVINQLWADIGNYAEAKAPPLLLAVALVVVARRYFRPKRTRARLAGALAPVVLVASFFIPTQHRHVQASTPDVLYLHSVGGLLMTQLGLTEQSNQLRPRARESLPVPPLERAAVPERNVLFVILESVRQRATCTVYDPACDKTEATNRLLPDRYSFTQMRAMDSCTAISLAVLWSGLYPTASRDELHTWPLIFDYARATGYDTAFWTSQNMMFGNARLWVKNLGVSQFVSATDLEPTADLDMGAPEHLLAEYVNENIGKLKEPFLGVIQLSNVHYPYYVDPNGPQPFQPAELSKGPDDTEAFLNYYQNAVYQQDQHLARILEHVRKSPFGPRTVIVYTSDHGEAFREHGQMGHTFSIFDEEIHVPMWIDAPPGTLTAEEEANLRKKKDAFLFHIDVAPTILDLIGVPKVPEIARYREKLHGHSLLEEATTDHPVPLTNCAGVWSCAFENWGVMQKGLKLEARSWDRGWKCYDLATDPDELTNLGTERCASLIPFAKQTFGRLPGEGIPK
jgi:glucan phosphoethanolaminetransferase (alkaline phosphatase superfamily)